MIRHVLMLDTATEVTVVALAKRHDDTISLVDADEIEAPRAAMSQLFPALARIVARQEIPLSEISELVVGRGPGSFTGVRIGVAAAKGFAHGLSVPLYGIGTLDTIAWHFAAREGLVGVVGDAMRGEVYPALYRAGAGRVERLTPDRVAHPEEAAREWSELGAPLLLAGNGLRKHAETFLECATNAELAPTDLWQPSALGLAAAYADAVARGALESGDPATLLPIYTRLSDAEEAESAAKSSAGSAEEDNRTPRSNESLPDHWRPGTGRRQPMKVALRAMRAADIGDVVDIESEAFTDAWSHSMFLDELWAPSRAWVVSTSDGRVVGYGGVALLGEDAHVMNVAVASEMRREGIGSRLMRALKARSRILGAKRITLEVREGNESAIAFYRQRGFEIVGRRAGYYAGTGEDALLMTAELDRDDELILAIETSCDETAAAVMRGGNAVLSSVVASQVDFHARFGGVVPEIASRKHTEAVVGVVDEALSEADLSLVELDAVAVTHGPGLVGALVVGLAYAKGLALAAGLPLIGVNHLEGHIFANLISDPEVSPPLVALVVSGGHTSLVHMPDWGEYRTLGETLDDAAGEAFDKVAKVLGLGYPGGPILSKLAAEGDPAAIDFPRAMIRSGDYRFSLSGLKTAVINHIRHEKEAGREIDVPDLAASFQQAVIDVQVAKALAAVEETGVGTFVLAGGVAANPRLRAELTAAMGSRGVRVSVPEVLLCTDNAAMIAAAAHYRYGRGEFLGIDAEADPGLRLDTPIEGFDKPEI